MRAALCLAAVAGLAGCSIFFDPSKAPVGCSPEECKARPNAFASCVSNQCVWQCNTGRTDPNGDLASATGNGCEACAPAALPGDLHAVVGNPSGGVNWEWDLPSADADAGTGNPVAFTLCTGALSASLTNCQSMDASVACTGSACGALTVGHPNDKRIYARVQATNACGATTASGPTRGTSPIDGTLLALKPSTSAGDNGCDAGFVTTDAGALRIHQVSPLSLCVSALTFGDDEWEDFTLTGQIKLPNRPPAAGFAFHYPVASAQKSRSSFLLTPSSTESEYSAGMTSIPLNQTGDKLSGTATPSVPPDLWLDVKVVSKGGDVAAAVGTMGDPKQALRWWEPAAGLKGRFAVYLITALTGQLESVEFQNVQISTRAMLPPRGPTTVKPVFQGPVVPAEGRVIPTSNASPNVAMATCMNAPEGTGCMPAGSCKPLTTSSCLAINQTPGVRRSVTFDQPLGLDTKQAWRISFKFLANTPNDSFAPILRTHVGGQILRGPMGAWPGALAVFGEPSDGTIEIMKWHKLELQFTGTNYETFLNGKKLNAAGLFPPAGWEAHLGAITFGGPEGLIPLLGQGNVQGQWTELEIAQPP